MVEAETRGGVDLVQVLDALVEIVLDGGEGGHNGGRAKPMGDHGEMGEVALYAGVQDGLGPGVAEGRSVLIQQVHQLLGNESIKEDGDKLLVVEKHVLNYAKFVQS